MRVMILLAVLVTTSCASPLSLRGARVLEPGEVEVLASPQVQFGVAEDEHGFSFKPELSARFGLVDRVDLQLRVDPTLIPEVSAGYQVLGDPRRDDDLALSVTGGAKVGVEYYGSGFTFAAVPLQMLLEVPLTDVIAFTGGLRGSLVAIAPLSTRNQFFGAADDAEPFGATLGAMAGLRVKTGALVLQPELGVAGGVGGYGAGAVGPARAAFVATVGLTLGGQFDLAAPASAPSRPPSPASLH